jgi:hypothetical protein
MRQNYRESAIVSPRRDENVRIQLNLRHRIHIMTRRLFDRFMGSTLAVGLVALTSWVPGAGAFAPKSELWERWTIHSSTGTAVIDHGEWDGFLGKNVVTHADGVNRIAYAKVSDADRKRLDDYLLRMSRVRISEFSRDEQRPYWINLYNAVTVDVVLDHYPVDSIRDISISPGLFSIGPWKKKLIRVEGEEISLDDIEHRILRPIWKDPRIHYAVNCASLGCPNLMPVAFTAANAEELLDGGAKNFINSEHGARFDLDARLIASSIYDWFQEDFGGSESGVIAHLRLYAKPALKVKLEAVTEVYDFDYDWTLNDAELSKAAK